MVFLPDEMCPVEVDFRDNRIDKRSPHDVLVFKGFTGNCRRTKR